MKKVITWALIAFAISGVYLSAVGYVGRKKENSLQRNVVRLDLSEKMPTDIDSAYVEKMIALGMNTTKEAVLLTYTKERQHWRKDFDVTFMGDNEMTEFLKYNSFILGEANRYLHMIPMEAGNTMIKNLDKINPPNIKKYRYWQTAGAAWVIDENDLNIKPKQGETFEYCNMGEADWLKIIKKSAILKYGLEVNCHSKIRLESQPTNKIFIIGSAKEFNTEGMVIEGGLLKVIPPKDPIAVLKVPNGYVELASWE